jgi:hypothetical protein
MALLPKLSPAIAFALTLSGCTWVSQQDFDDKVACLDQDGDGAIANAANCPDELATELGYTLPLIDDCSDDPLVDSTAAQRSPVNDEAGTPAMWYDGIDQDCDGLDVIDSDGDTYPGKLETEWTAQHANLTYPAGLVQEIDCDDTVDSTYPGSGAELPYDGVDGNCDGKDDWDFDEDGVVPYEALYISTPGTIAYTGIPVVDGRYSQGFLVAAPTLALNDDEYGIAPLALTIDDTHITAYLAFQARYKYAELRACTLADGSCHDCQDDPEHSDKAIKAANLIHSAAVETWYDGVDQDCAGDNDYDQDHDLYVDENHDAQANGLGTGDCADGDSTRNPGAIEASR